MFEYSLQLIHDFEKKKKKNEWNKIRKYLVLLHKFFTLSIMRLAML